MPCRATCPHLSRAAFLAISLAGAIPSVGTLAASASAAQVAGERLPATLSVAGHRLELAGCAAREVLWRDVYALGLYLPQPQQASVTVGHVRDPSIAKAVRLKVAYEGDVPDELPDKWQEGLRQAYSQELVRMFQGHYRTLKTGDTLTISYAPGRDTTVLLNGEPIISKPGHELMDALLGLWVGQDPVSEDMRREILAGSC